MPEATYGPLSLFCEECRRNWWIKIHIHSVDETDPVRMPKRIDCPYCKSPITEGLNV